MSLLRTLSFVTRHPLIRRRPVSALTRFAKWQIQRRMKQEVKFGWIGHAELIARIGMTGATGNVYGCIAARSGRCSSRLVAA